MTLEINKLQSLFNDVGLNHQIIHFNEIDSTNSYALNNLNILQFPAVITTNQQTNGRGRFERKWQSNRQDITASIVYQFSADYQLSLLPLVISVALNRLLKDYRIQNKIKWPNDIYVANNKVCGILVENVFRNKTNHTIIGVGLNNINNWEQNKLLTDLVNAIDKMIKEFSIFGFEFLRREWLDNCIHHNLNVSLSKYGEIIASGIHTDIASDGSLIVKTDEGNLEFSSSALSLSYAPLDSN